MGKANALLLFEPLLSLLRDSLPSSRQASSALDDILGEVYGICTVTILYHFCSLQDASQRKAMCLKVRQSYVS